MYNTKELAENLHFIFCYKKHESNLLKVLDESSNLCCWDLEELLDEAWDYRDHRWWFFLAQTIEEKGAARNI